MLTGAAATLFPYRRVEQGGRPASLQRGDQVVRREEAPSEWGIDLPDPCPRRATARPTRQNPTIPSVLPWMSWPSIIIGPQIQGVLLRRNRSPSGTLRAAAINSAQAVSAVVSVRTP